MRDRKLPRRIAAHVNWLRRKLKDVDREMSDAIEESPLWRVREDRCDLFRYFHQAFAEIFSAEESDEGGRCVFEAVDNIFPILQATVPDPPGKTCAADFMLILEIVNQESLDL